MSEPGETELGRSKKAATPAEHLKHLLNIGWQPSSPLIQRYVKEHGLQKELQEQVLVTTHNDLTKSEETLELP